MNYFICDIAGTFNGCTDNRKENVERFINNLKSLMEKEKLDNLTFCFESSDSIKYVKRYVDEISDYLENSNINLGLQFGFDKYLEYGIERKFDNSSKVYQTAFMLKEKEIGNIYYADDYIGNHQLLDDLLLKLLRFNYINSHNTDKGFREYNKIVHFMPGIINEDDDIIGSKKNDISGLNDALEEYIDKLKLSKKNSL